MQAGGRLAFVLQASIASGESWGLTRSLLANRYHLETVVASHDAERLAFSENSDISEVLIIAKRRKVGEKPGPTRFINLWRNPRSIYEAMEVAGAITQAPATASVDDMGTTDIRTGASKVGEMVLVPHAEDDAKWHGALFAQTDLLRVFWKLRRGELALPGQPETHAVPICALSELGSLGPDVRRLADGYRFSRETWSPYPAFWDHKHDQVVKLTQEPNGFLLAREDSPRGPDYGAHLWERAGNILLAERLRSNTHKVVALRFSKQVLGNTWWSLAPRDLSAHQQRALVLWLNSSLSILLLYANRVITHGAWFKMKQPAWASMPVLDVRNLDVARTNALASAYRSLATHELLSLSRLDVDETRKAIDAALSETLGLPNLGPIRELLAREPGLNARAMNAETESDDLGEDDD
jgi:hypothetical protein